MKLTQQQADAFWDDATKRVWFLRASKRNTYFGLPTMKNPLDMWVYQSILYDLKPSLVVEFGTWYGASALWFAQQCEILGSGHVVTVDIEKRDWPKHPNLTTVHGDSLSRRVYDAIEKEIHLHGNGHVLFVEDSRHSRGHVMAELNAYSHLVTVGSYFIVEDCKLGVRMAVERFLQQDNCCFVQDKHCERFRITNCKGGFLKRVK